VIVAGFGFRSGATVDSLADALARAGGPAKVGALATAADKARSPALRQLARQLALRIRSLPPEALRAQQISTHSAASLAAHGTGSVAEAAALAAAGAGARLIVLRVVSGDGRATCALAEGEGAT